MTVYKFNLSKTRLYIDGKEVQLFGIMLQTIPSVKNVGVTKDEVKFSVTFAARLSPYVRCTCTKCGVSWPYNAQELMCCCAPNEEAPK